MNRVLAAILLVAALCIAGGCGSVGMPGSQCTATDQVSRPNCVYVSWKHQLDAAAIAREETLMAAGYAAQKGTITVQQLAIVMKAGDRALEALRAAYSALAVAMEIGSGGNPWGAIIDAQEAIVALVRAAGGKGVST